MGRENQAVSVSLSGCVLLLLMCACAPQKKVAGHLHQLRYEWQTNIYQQANLAERVLDWTTAVAIMRENNLKLKQSRMELTNAQESVRQVYRDLIPTLNMRAGVSKQITSLDRITADDITFSADSFFSIPGVVNFGARLYAARLYEMRARAAYELAEREQMIELYRLFYGAEELMSDFSRIETERATATAMEQVDPFSGRLMFTELRSRELASEREFKTHQDRASELLGSREYLWVFSTNGLPELRYHQNPLPLDDTNRVAQLQMRLLAVELEAARATLNGLKLRYWPELNIFVTSPPIYQRSGGVERWWDADRMRVTADLFWTVDTRGHIRRLIRQTARQQQLQNERYRQESLALMNRLLFTQRLADDVQLQLDRVDAQLRLLVAVPPAQNLPALEKYSYDYRLLAEQQLRLRRELSELNALFWFVDEDAWPNQQPVTANNS